MPGPPPRRPEDAAQIAELVARVQRLSRELDEARSELGHVRGERDRLQKALSEQGAAREARARAEEARERDQAATIAALRGQLAESERRGATSREAELRELEARVDELEAQSLEVASLRAQNAELEARLLSLSSAQSPIAESPQKAAPRRGTNGSHGDDLKQIRGIGPAFERALKARGVTTFAQIASWGASEVEETARALRLKPERIRKEDWVGGASSLLGAAEKG